MWIAVRVIACFASSAVPGVQAGDERAPEVLIGPIPGFTTSAHSVPTPTVLPVDVVVPFRVVGVDPGEEVWWTGPGFAQEGRVAWFFLGALGDAEVVCELPARDLRLRCPLQVREVRPADLIAPPQVDLRQPFVLEEDMDSRTAVGVYFDWGSVGDLHGAGRRLVVSVRSELELTPRFVAGSPPATVFDSLYEWRVDGRAIGVGRRVWVPRETGERWLEGGPPQHAEGLSVTTYSVTIEHDYPPNGIPEDVPVEFRAQTEPPGHEARVRWLAATKYGSAEPTLGQGARFVTTFRDTFGGPGGDSAQWLGVRGDNRSEGQDAWIDLDVDTDRDAVVEDVDDEPEEDQWTKDRGAIFNVNHDRDGARTAGGKPIPDAVHFDDDGDPVEEDGKIDNAADENDIAPLVVRTRNFDAATCDLFLVASEREDIQSIHVFPEIKAGVAKIWGSLGDRLGGTPEPMEVQIDDYVPATGDVTFGIEGMFHRYPSGWEANEFDGYVDIALELRQGANVIACDEVRLKVAPWMGIEHPQESVEIWAADGGNRQ